MLDATCPYTLVMFMGYHSGGIKNTFKCHSSVLSNTPHYYLQQLLPPPPIPLQQSLQNHNPPLHQPNHQPHHHLPHPPPRALHTNTLHPPRHLSPQPHRRPQTRRKPVFMKPIPRPRPRKRNPPLALYPREQTLRTDSVGRVQRVLVHPLALHGGRVRWSERVESHEHVAESRGVDVL